MLAKDFKNRMGNFFNPPVGLKEALAIRLGLSSLLT